MLSILIPVYNYNIVELVNTIHKQSTDSKIIFEIICIDDMSDNKISDANSIITTLKNISYLKNKTNLGRNKTRQLLYEKASYNWLLFLDADVLPKNNAFIKNYLPFINQKFDAIYGGFAYYKETPEKSLRLRWEYGRKREEVSSSKRNKKPYKSIISANFMIKKTVFNTINSKITGNLYGEDNHFGALLKENKAKVIHINNEVYHLGIEPSIKYLKKKEQAAKTLLNLYNSEKKIIHDNDLLRLFEKSKRYKYNYFFAFFFKIFRHTLRKNLLGNKPGVNILQLYRISFMCYEDLKRN